jgi:hypothetical protein
MGVRAMMTLDRNIGSVDSVLDRRFDRRKFLREFGRTAVGIGLLATLSGSVALMAGRIPTEIESIILAAHADGRSSVVVPPGIYECPIAVRLLGVSGLEIIVDGVQIVRRRAPGRPTKTLEFWSLASCSDLRIVGDMSITGWKPFVGQYWPPAEGHHAFGIHACERLTIEGTKVRHVWGDFFYLASRGRRENYRPNRDLQLIDIDADDCGRHSIGMHAIDGIDVVRGTFSNWRGKALTGRGIDFEKLVPGDYHANIHISPETEWIHSTPEPRP